MGFLENLIRRRVLEIAGILNLSRYIAFPYFFTHFDDYDASLSGWFRDSITFVDGSRLWIRERYRLADWKLTIRYGYVYSDASGHERLRFDNAPHHPGVWTFPHHKHLAGDPEVKPFSDNLRDAIAEIDALIAANLAT